MYVSKGRIKQHSEKKTKMLTLFKTLTEEDKDFVISMSDSLARKHGTFLKAKMGNAGQKPERSFAHLTT